jgi:hypothetical protein
MFSAMVPAPQTKSSPLPQSVPEGDTLTATTDTNMTVDNQNNKTGKNRNQPDRKPRTPSQSDLLLEKYRKITPQVAGGLGDQQELFANSNQLVKQAMKYKKSDPKAFNALVQLGIEGKKMAKAMSTYQSTNASQDLDVLMGHRSKYENKLAGISATAADKKLSAEDRAKVDDLGWDSANLASRASRNTEKTANAYCLLSGWGCLSFYTSKHFEDAKKEDADKTVDSNSNKIVDCGKQGTCKK